MKRGVLLLAMIALVNTSFAQIGRGFFAGGQLGFTTAKTNYKNGSNSSAGPRSSSFNLMPRVGYFFNDRLGAGVVFGYNSVMTRTETVVLGISTTNKDVLKGWTTGLFGRYAMGLGEGASFFLVGDLNLMFSGLRGRNTTTVGTTSTTIEADPQSTITIGLAPAFLFFPTNKVGLELALGNLLQFSSTTTTSAGNGDNKTVVSGVELLNFNTMGLSLGANYYFSR